MKKLLPLALFALLSVGAFAVTPVFAEEVSTLSADCEVIMPTGTVDSNMATLIVPDGACSIVVSFSSYTFDSTILPYEEQTFVDNITDTYGPGTHNIGPLELGCNWQTDLYVGEVQIYLTTGGHDTTNGPIIGYDFLENQDCSPPLTTATIYATKIVCDSESDLPNWGAGGPNVTSSTASDFLATHPNCHEAEWIFEWASAGTTNPGDQTGVAGGVWTPFTSSATITVPSDPAYVWVREQFKNEYIPFTGLNTTENVSAELYCDVDTLNYDNYDRVDNMEVGHSYNCVGFNVLVPEEEEEDMVLTVIKNVVGGTATSGAFMIQVSGGEATPSAFPGNASGTTVSINASSTYSVTETPVSGYTASYSPECSGVSWNNFHPRTCVITNTFIDHPADCEVIMPTGTVNFAMATLIVPEGACPVMVSFSSYTFASTIVPYHHQILVDNITDTYGPGTYHIGPLELRCNWQTDLYVGPVQTQLLEVGGHDQSQYPVLGYNYMENQICDEGKIVVTKIVVNDNGGTKQIADFPLKVGTTTVTSGATTTFAYGTYNVSETFDSSLYTQSFSGDCDSSGNLIINSTTTKTCVITNNDIAPSVTDGDNSSRRRRSGGRGTVLGISAQPEITPEVLGVQYEIMPGLPSTGLGPISLDASGSNNIEIVVLGLLAFLSLNIFAIYAIKRRSL